jgi:hypothetical protein
MVVQSLLFNSTGFVWGSVQQLITSLNATQENGGQGTETNLPTVAYYGDSAAAL